MPRASALLDTRIIHCGDCLEQLKQLPDQSVDLCYIDPPFNSNRNYEVFWGETKERRSFEDRHESTKAYIDYMRPRVVEIARVLKKTGSFYYHCDWHASHYVKVMLDVIFGENNFQNEIIWKRTFAHSGASRYGTVHDTLFFYSMSADYTWNKQFQPYDPEYIETFFNHKDERDQRWMRMDLTGDGIRNGDSGEPWRGIDVTAKGRHWAIPLEEMLQYRLPSNATSQEKLDALDAAGAIHWPKKEGGVPRLKRYASKSPGVPLQSVWNDIRPIHNLSTERLGYPTQKPLALLERIIKASSMPNQIVLDAFCGCGTALVAAQKLERQWVGIDISPTACRVMAKRLKDVTRLQESEKLWRVGRGFVVRDLPKTEQELRKIPHFEFENWAVIALGGIGNKAQVGDMGLDGRVYPVDTKPAMRPNEFDFMDVWYPIQVKQKEKAGRPDIDALEAAMIRAERMKGFFVSFGFTGDALVKIRRFRQQTGREIVPLTVKEILEDEIAMRMV